MSSLIPTFEVGQRVRVVNKPVEWFCPGCGRELFETWAKDSYLATILCGDGHQCRCRYCGDAAKLEGWIRIQLDGFNAATWAPYTLLEPLED